MICDGGKGITLTDCIPLLVRVPYRVCTVDGWMIFYFSLQKEFKVCTAVSIVFNRIPSSHPNSFRSHCDDIAPLGEVVGCLLIARSRSLARIVVVVEYIHRTDKHANSVFRSQSATDGALQV